MSNEIIDTNPPGEPDIVTSDGFNFTMLYSEDLVKQAYENNLIYKFKNFYIYASKEVEGEFNVSEALEEIVLNDSAVYDYVDGLSITLFANHNGAELLRQYKDTVAKSNELILFLELDDSTNIMGSVMRARIGSDLMKKQNLASSELLRFVQSNGINISQDRLQLLLKESAASDAPGFLKWFSGALQDVGGVFDYLLEKVEVFFEKDIPKQINDYKIKEKRWDPKHEKYDPIFIPRSIEKKLSSKTNESSSPDYDNLIKSCVDPLFTKIDRLKNKVDFKIDSVGSLLPDAMVKKLKETVHSLFSHINNIKAFILDPEQGFMLLLQKSIRAFNAMLCGLYNSIIDLISGIFMLIGLLVKAIRGIGDYLVNMTYYNQLFEEVIENLIGDFLKVDWLGVLKNMVKFAMYVPLMQFDLLINKSKALYDNLERVFYYTGYVLGFILETVLSVLFSGGALTIKTVLKELKAPIDLVNMIGKGLKNTIGKAKNEFDKIIAFIRYIFKELKNPDALVKKIKQFVSEVFQGIKANEKVQAYIKFSRQLRKAFDELGWEVLVEAKYVVVRTRQGLDGQLYSDRKFDLSDFKEAIDKFNTNFTVNTKNLRKALDDLELKKFTDYIDIDVLNKLGLKVKSNNKTVDLLDSNGNIIFRGSKNSDEINNYLFFVDSDVKIKRDLIKEVNDELRSNNKRYKVERENALKHNVPLSKNGTSPDFSNLNEYLYDNNPNFGNVKIKVTGVRSIDFKYANEVMDLKRTPEGYTWHHLDDLDENLECTMQLVKEDVHLDTYSHFGSAKQFEELFKLEKYR